MKEPQEHRAYQMPACGRNFMQVMLPHPCRVEDLEILRKWLDMFEDVLTEGVDRLSVPESSPDDTPTP